MRTKEEAHDYRYFPDPDLLPLELDDAFVEEMAKSLPELPDAKKARFILEYGLSSYDAGVLVADKAGADFFEAAVKAPGRRRDSKAVVNWTLGDLSANSNASSLPYYEAGLSPAAFATFVDLVGDGTISGKQGKDLLVLLVGEEKGADPRELAQRRGMRQVSDAGEIERAVDAVLAANTEKAEQARSKPGMLGWFVGQVMKATGGKANPQAVSDAMKARLGL
jgi:aspartyl-tRNA(Asn)/glutamyl-tRNA(Gln) amidotransferase subunit B